MRKWHCEACSSVAAVRCCLDLEITFSKVLVVVFLWLLQMQPIRCINLKKKLFFQFSISALPDISHIPLWWFVFSYFSALNFMVFSLGLESLLDSIPPVLGVSWSRAEMNITTVWVLHSFIFVFCEEAAAPETAYFCGAV